MKDYSSDRKTLEFLLPRQNERQLRKTSWIGLLSLLLDDNFRHYNQEREKFWMHAFFDASFERLFKGRGKSYRKDWNIFLQAKNADERLHIILRKTCLFDGKWLFLISEDVFWFERLESTICGDTHKTYRLIFFTLKICTFSENRGKMKGGIFSCCAFKGIFFLALLRKNERLASIFLFKNKHFLMKDVLGFLFCIHTHTKIILFVGYHSF